MSALVSLEKKNPKHFIRKKFCSTFINPHDSSVAVLGVTNEPLRPHCFFMSACGYNSSGWGGAGFKLPALRLFQFQYIIGHDGGVTETHSSRTPNDISSNPLVSGLMVGLAVE